MASVHLQGILLDSLGEIDVGAIVTFTHLTTTGETIATTKVDLIIPPDGAYSIDVEFGQVRVDYTTRYTEQFVAIVIVNGDTVATSLPELLNAAVPVTDPVILEMQGILADAEAAADTSEAFANQMTTFDLIGSTAIFAPDTNITTKGYLTSGDGGDDSWIQNGVTAQPVSQTPLQLSDRLLNDGNGNQWALVGADGISLNALGATHTSDLGVYLTVAGDIIRASLTADGAGLNSMPIRITLNNGAYTQTTSGNLQSMTSQDWELDFTGSHIVGECTGKTMFDLLGSRFGTLKGVHLHGHITNTPAIGYQYGRLVAATSADNLSFINCKGSGHFSRADAYNLASETEYWEQLELYNHSVLADSYCHIWDGNNTWLAITDFTAPSMAQYTPMSCIQHTFDNPDWRKTFGGSTMWMSRTNQWTVYNGYAVTVDAYALIMSSDDFGFDGIRFDAHTETSTSLAAIQFVMNPAASGTTCNVRGFEHTENGCQFSNSVYKSDVTTLNLIDVDIQITRFQAGVPPNGLVIPIVGVTISGDIYSGDAALYKGFDHYGEISSPNAATGDYGLGNYTIRDTTSGMVWIKGETRFVGREAQSLSGSNLLTQRYTEMNNGRLKGGEGEVNDISAGAITVDRIGYWKVGPQTFGVPDNLDTITGGEIGDVLILRQSTATTITIRDGVGNILLTNSDDYSFPDAATVIELLYDGANWIQVSASSDYAQEGTFTPIIAFGNLSVGVTYATQTGYWTRVRDMVTFSANVLLTSKGTSVGSATMQGLGKVSDGASAIAASFAAMTAGVGDQSLSAEMNDGNAAIFLRAINPSGVNVSLDDTDFTNTTEVSVSGSFKIT